jgi:DNA gyrase subunit A
VKTDGKKQIILGTELGQAVRFDEEEVRSMGRTAYGVWGVDLEAGDHVVSLGVAEPGCELLTVTEKGYGKRTPLEEYRKTARGAKGVRTIIVNDRNGKVVCVRPVKGDESLLLLTALGIAIRMKIGGDGGISTIGRSTQGVRVVRLDEGDLVSQVALLPAQEDDSDALVLPPALAGGPPPDLPPAVGDPAEAEPSEPSSGQP